MKIIIDAMGGDHAPEEIVKGAIDATKEFGIEVVLIGVGETILHCLNDIGLDNLPKGIEVAHADDVVTMEDDPTLVMKTRKNSSMVQGLRMLAEGQGDAFISAGNTGALLSAGTLTVKRIKGIRRAAFAPVLPSKTGSFILIDCGANAECTPEFLLQFGIMGSVYAECILKREKPKVALLNNGTEDCKGTPLQKESYQLLKQASDNGIINFIGNIEAREAMLGEADVLVTDGFTGNIMLKSVEGTAIFLMSRIKKVFLRNVFTKLSALCCKGGLNELKSMMDYRETGGTALVGLQKPVIKAHGTSDARAIRSAVKQAIYAVENSMEGELTERIRQYAAVKETSSDAQS